MKRALWWIFRGLIILVLPFVALIRGSIFWHERYNMEPYLALLGGLLITFVLLLLYVSFVLKKISARSSLRSRMVIVGLVLGSYALYGLFYVSSSNVKSSEIQSEYRSLHPILRLAVSSLIMADPQLMITDANRSQQDYTRWGLPVNSRSLHYRQQSGYVHAMDLRSRDRGSVRNVLVKSYFRLMGFNVLHHSGTAEHLHISLMSHDQPWSK
ncbi:MAG: hypothetical protein KTR24_02665 [Saprospiraceae bacterium]|nr:hypothetical protein [Saprospiraceae bacterium]